MLIDMEGRVVQTWSSSLGQPTPEELSWRRIWPHLDFPGWEHVELAAGGDLLAIVPFRMVLRLELGPMPAFEELLPLRQRRLDWAALLARVHGEDILVCPKCGHRPMRVIAAIDDPPLVNKILDHLGLPAERPAISLARSPPQLELDDDFGDSTSGTPSSDSELDVN